MGSSVLGSIKKESVRNIFSSVCENGQVSRAQIAKETGLSLMTVGKAVDELLCLGYVSQEKENKSNAGRKAGLVFVNPEKFILVLDLTVPNFQMTVMNSSFRIIDRISYEFDTECYSEENLCIFLKNVKIYTLRRLDMDNCIGIGVLVPGFYDEQSDKVAALRSLHLENIKIRAVIEEILKFPITFIKNDIRSAAISNMTDIADYRSRNIAYVRIGRQINGALLSKGAFIGDKSAVSGMIGKMHIGDDYTLNEVIEAVGLSDRGCDALAWALYNIVCVTDTDVFVIENELPKPQDLCAVIEQKLAQRLCEFSRSAPRVVLSDAETCHAPRGIAMRIRNRWIEDLLEK